ncbi:hypothetical protein [Caballeronia glathei]|uniref:Uncharacterized protein n=1 Tax=Caballeronia glathei TaxID=60547 RepID=A0A069PMF9_9BURK|nr:hypothetical protein [Caballeronia glathei]KDR41602.1 hypothetical protein BG61_16945 [Caballeronia glathei]
MANHLDLPRKEADELLAVQKSAPEAAWIALSSGRIESWALVTGVITPGGLYKKALTVELICKRSVRPLRESFKFSLFRLEFGAPKRAYQLDTSNVPLCDPEDHDWPHEHIGTDRICFGSSAFPQTFEEALEHFCNAVNIQFDEVIESPLEFKLR